MELNDGVYKAQASLQINDSMVITRIERIAENRITRVPVVQVVWRVQTVFVPRDPLSQTFSFTQNQVVSSIGLHFTARAPAIPVTVQIRGVTTGLPNILLQHAHNIGSARATIDIDIGVFVSNWDQFQALKKTFVATGKFSSTRQMQRLIYGDALPVDIVPFGGIAEDME